MKGRYCRVWVGQGREVQVQVQDSHLQGHVSQCPLLIKKYVACTIDRGLYLHQLCQMHASETLPQMLPHTTLQLRMQLPQATIWSSSELVRSYCTGFSASLAEGLREAALRLGDPMANFQPVQCSSFERPWPVAVRNRHTGMSPQACQIGLVGSTGGLARSSTLQIRFTCVVWPDGCSPDWLGLCWPSMGPHGGLLPWSSGALWARWCSHAGAWWPNCTGAWAHRDAHVHSQTCTHRLASCIEAASAAPSSKSRLIDGPMLYCRKSQTRTGKKSLQKEKKTPVTF